MELTLKELNEMYYCLHIAVAHHLEHQLLDVKSIDKLVEKIRDEIDLKIYEMDNDEDADEDYRASLQQDEQRYENKHK